MKTRAALKTTPKQKSSEEKTKKVTVTPNGPYLVCGSLPLAKEAIVFNEKEGCPGDWAKGDTYPEQETYALCRCGQSSNKPFCDGTHAKAGFNGTETASRAKFINKASAIEGKDIMLLDVPDLCSRARFCHQAGGIWELVYKQKDKETTDRAVRIAGQCPSGRLVIWDKKAERPVEPRFDPSISIVEDPDAGVSGPIWLKGGIPLESANGKKYETRNRMTLCRCGQSSNKPFCDGSHIDAEFNDGDGSLKQRDRS